MEPIESRGIWLVRAGIRLTSRRKISTTLKEVVRDDGIQGLWRGTIPTLVR